MSLSTLVKKLRPHLIALAGLLLLSFLYLWPVTAGKSISMTDIQQSVALAREIQEVDQQTGQKPLWTEAAFSGMPGYMISFNYPYIMLYKAVTGLFGLIPSIVAVLFAIMLGAYILLVVLGCNPWLAATGAAAYGLGTYGIVSLEAGHVSKLYAMGFGAGLVAGVILALRGRYWMGAALTGLFLSLEIGANHIQITYYLFMAIALYLLFEGVALVRMGKSRQLLLGLLTLTLAGTLGLGSFSKRLLVLNQYTKETIRGRSELTARITNPDGKSSQNESTDGLNKEYAFTYSYGLAETLTLLIPGLYGGASNGGLSTNSDFYRAMINRGIDPSSAKQFVEQGVPVYWGETPIVGGPAYAGAAVLFLFILSLFVLRGPLRWWLISAVSLLLIIAWGKNFAFVNYFLFDYLPYLNKFRAMTMALGLAQLFLALGAVLGLQTIISQQLTLTQLKQPLLISLGATAGLSLLIALAGSGLFSFQSPNDLARLAPSAGDAANEYLVPLIQDRQHMLRSDGLRSALIVLLTAGIIWALIAHKMKPRIAYSLLLVVVVVDLAGVDKRFLNNADFVPKSQLNQVFEPTPADQQILLDRSLGYRVFDQTEYFMESNRASYFHRSIGGYSTTRLRRYNELMTYAFPGNSGNILNMLNAKYVIQPGQPDPTTPRQSTAPVALLNSGALGVAWFVTKVTTVTNADEELTAMKQLTTRDTAVVDKQFAAQLAGLPAQLNPTGSTIELTDYRPDHLTYRANTAQDGLVVFSEIYYRGQDDWQASIDGKLVPHLRANYVLRALRLPKGNHIVEFKFDPPLAKLGDKIDLLCNLLLIALLGFVFYRETRARAVLPT